VNNKREIIFHSFLWQVKDVINNLEYIKTQGFTSIQLTPCQKLKDNSSNSWWMVYQSCGFDTIGNRYGSAEDIKELCDKATILGITVIADIVINHICGDLDGSLNPYKDVDKILLDNPQFFKESKVIHNWKDRNEVVNYNCQGLPTLRLDNHKLQDIVIDFLNRLIDIGISGFRIDSCKQIKLPSEGSDFFTRVFNNLHKKKEELLIYGEIIFESKQLISEYCKYINVLTNTYDGCDKTKIITFNLSHDSELEFKYTNKMDDNMITNEWRFLLQNNQESGMIFYPRAFNNLWKSDTIREINNVYR